MSYQSHGKKCTGVFTGDATSPPWVCNMLTHAFRKTMALHQSRAG